ncbi:hypothetical protein KP509_32G059600 [Ceratopteris richardii]|uniref:non-specific serine/threonine protein kinase n=1 Tax=Ceratopteris richardii TaxID=49495 RepID=A0A8T2QUD6_CERRI|nr:hypothetical protein KP509_32G059600 [Ceratopteris richardii]
MDEWLKLTALVVTTAAMFMACGAAEALSSEGAALLELKAGISDPFGHLSDWLTSDSFPCTWTGVTCNTSGSVTALDISQRNLSGTLSDAALRRLPGLSYFNVCCNSFASPLPSAFFVSMPALNVLDVSRNYFIGNFPDFGTDPAAALPSLTFFSAFSNNFTGPIPAAFSRLPKLQHLDLGGSFFDGNIPRSLGDLSGLNYLGLSGNLLTGAIPHELGSLGQLRYLFMAYNRLNGSIPPEIGKLVHLEYMDLCCTGLSGPIPPELGQLKSLNTLFLYKNELTGQIPPQLGGMTSLMSLDLSVNNLSGRVPPEFGHLKNLTLLSLFYNNLNGSLPTEIGELPNLLTLLIWNNSFSGKLPESLGRSSPLQWLDVSSNFFEGPIPPDVCLQSNLSKLILFSNRLSGPIPTKLATCQSLLRVRLQDNQITGTIPAGFGYLPKLTRLEFQMNKLSGQIPTDICNSSKLNYIDLSFNKIDGELPANMWQLLNLQSFLASGNNLTGIIPSDPEAACESLAVLSLSLNSLSGRIPASLSNCQKLITIQLQQNRFTGSIPPELASVPNLEVLDLSQNYLSGQIPPQFQNLTTLEAFNVSYNNLSGPVPLEGMFKTASTSSFLGNPYLCGGVLPRSCIGLGDENQPSDKGRRRNFEPMWLIGLVFGFSLIILITGGQCLFKQYGGRFCSKDALEDMDEWPWRLTAFQRLSFTSNDILDALKDENIVGRGATGIVYRARMPSGEVVAVKKLWMSHKSLKNGKSKEPRGFQIEIDLLGSIRHRNIVRLLGYCSNNINTLLIYEYMTNGSLDDALHAKGNNYILADWVTRYNIAVGIAQGLCYLHHDCFPQVVHRDVKSNNILLDCKLDARIADFGVAKLIERNESMSMIAGSYGYIAPEYAYTLKVDEKTDIYSFGVVLLELLTGRRPIEPEFGDAANIVEWVRGKVRSKTGIVDALDANVGATCATIQEEMLLVLRIALLCTSRCPHDRPSMRDVVTMLAEAKPRRKSITTTKEPRNGSGPLE